MSGHVVNGTTSWARVLSIYMVKLVISWVSLPVEAQLLNNDLVGAESVYSHFPNPFLSLVFMPIA